MERVSDEGASNGIGPGQYPRLLDQVNQFRLAAAVGPLVSRSRRYADVLIK
jgi:hypothetical protein